MDSFENKVTQIQNEIHYMHNNIKSVKSTNTSAINRITNSLNSLSHHNSSSKLCVVNPTPSTARNYKRNAFKRCLLKMEVNNFQSKKRNQQSNETLQREETYYTSPTQKLHQTLDECSHRKRNNYPTSVSRNSVNRRNVNYFLEKTSSTCKDSDDKKYKQIVRKIISLLKLDEYEDINEDNVVSVLEHRLHRNKTNEEFIKQIHSVYVNNKNYSLDLTVNNDKLFKWIVEDKLHPCSIYKDYFNQLQSEYKVMHFEDMTRIINDSLRSWNSQTSNRIERNNFNDYRRINSQIYNIKGVTDTINGCIDKHNIKKYGKKSILK